ncbi:hypothetical protein FIU86_18540 [Roseovarius sp. THAF9]|nr:hypothetical protein FIU86_18540 [Roseovarius sp. THAF9]
MIRTIVQTRDGQSELSEKAQRLLAAHDREVRAFRAAKKA